MTQKELDTLRALSSKREREELTPAEKKYYTELLKMYEEYDTKQYVALQRASI